MTTITETSTAAVVEMLAKNAQEKYDALSVHWPKEMKASGDKVMTLIQDEVTQLLSGDLSAIRAALVTDILHAFKTGKGPISKSLADLA